MVQQSNSREVWENMSPEQKEDMYRNHLYTKYKQLSDDEQRAFILKTTNEKPGLLDGLKTGGLKVLNEFNNQITRIGGAVRAANNAGISEITEAMKEGRTPNNLTAHMVEAFADQLFELRGARNAPTSEEMLDTIQDALLIDIKNDPQYRHVYDGIVEKIDNLKLSESFPGAFSETGEEWLKFKKDGFADFTAKGTAGFVLDAGQDIPIAVGFKLLGETIKPVVSTFSKGTSKLLKKIHLTDKGTPKFKTGKEVKDALIEEKKYYLNPKRAPDLDAMERIKKKHGIQGELTDQARYGKDSALGKMERVHGGHLAEKRFGVMQSEIADAWSRKVNTISRGQSTNVSDAGQSLMNSLQERAKTIIKQNEFNYQMIAKKSPHKLLSKKAAVQLNNQLKPIEAKLMDKYKVATGSQKEAIKQSLDDIATIRANPSFKLINEKRALLGENLGDKTTKELYGALSDSMKTHIVDLPNGKKMLKHIEQNNKAIAEMYNDKFLLRAALDKNADPRAIYDKLIKNGSPQQIDAVKRAVGENSDVWAQIKATYIDDMAKSAGGKAKNWEDVWAFMNNGRKSKVGSILTDQESLDVAELLWFAQQNGIKPSVIEAGMTTTTVRALRRAALRKKAETGSFLPGVPGGEVLRRGIPATIRQQEVVESRRAKKAIMKASKPELEGISKNIKKLQNKSLEP